MSQESALDGPQPSVRRPMTAVFVDVVGSTPLSILMEDEAYGRLIADYRQISAEIIAAADGFVPKDEGDGRFVWFGWPTARRDDAQRAVAFGQDLLRAVEPLSDRVQAETGRDFMVRVGMHTGPVVVTFPQGAETPSVNDATVNFAAKVQQAAAPGTVFVSEATVAAMTDGFELEPRGAIALDGLPGEISVFRVVGSDRLPVEDGSFIGRAAELAELARRWDLVAAGGSDSLTITGSAGMGKTRLVNRFVTEAVDGATIRIQCDPQQSHTPFAALRSAARAAPIGARDQPWVPGSDREANAEELVGLLRTSARNGPLILIVDDAQWLDPSSTEIVARVCLARIPGLMTVLTTRRNLDGSSWPTVEELRLPPLSSDESYDLLHSVRPGVGDQPERAEELLARAAGNPFFLVWLGRANDESSFVGIRRLLRPRSGVPAVVQQAVRSQIDGAAVDDDITAMAAIIGMDFDLEVLAASLRRPAKELLEPLGRLVDHDIAVRRDGVTAGYRFSHGLVRELAYDLLLEDARRSGHGRLADTLTEQGSSDHAVIGVHHDRAGRPEEAGRHKILAARQCLRSNAYVEGAALITRTLEIIDEASDKVTGNIVVEAHELDATFAVAVSPDSYRAGTSVHSGVLDLLDAREHPRRVAMAKTRDWAGAVMNGELATSGRLLRDVRKMAISDFPEIMVCNRNARGLHAAYRGRYEFAERLLCESTDEMERDGIDPWLEENWATPDDPRALALSFAPMVLHQRGRRQLAESFLDRAWQRAESVPSGGHTMVHVGSNAATFWELAGDGERARELGAQVAELGQELGLDPWVLNGQIHMRRGEAMVAPTPALAEMLDADAALLDAFAPVGAGVAHLQAAKAWLEVGDYQRVETALAAMRATSEKTGMYYLDAEELRLQSSTLEEEAAVAVLVQAATLASWQGAKRFQLRALCDLERAHPDGLFGGAPTLGVIENLIASFPEPDADSDYLLAEDVLKRVDV